MESQNEELYKWIREHSLSRPISRINRDFADTMLLVEILNTHLPELVLLHEYSPKNSYLQKLNNWETVNNKVLKKININLTKKQMEQLARAEPGVIEQVLLQVKNEIAEYKASYLGKPPRFTSKTQNKASSAGVSHEYVNQLRAEAEEKRKKILFLRKKVAHLEYKVKSQVNRLRDLNLQLEILVKLALKPEFG